MKRTLIKDSPAYIGKQIKIAGWVNSLRKHGQLVFADIRDRSGILQVVGGKNLSQLKEESAVEVLGAIKSRQEKYFNAMLITGQVEMEVDKAQILSPSQDLPFDVHQPDLNVSLPVLLDYRAASLRNQKIADIFRVQSTITQAFRRYLVSQDFTEFHAPTIVATATEGGSQVFPVDYFGYKAFLAQSPQLYKQIMVTAFERVFTIAHAYRAEPSVTTRHLTEYVSLDVEMGFIESWLDVVHTADSVVKAIFESVAQNHGDILEKYGVTVPKTVKNTPIIKLSEALENIYQRTGRDIRDELDLDPEGEREICRWSLEKHGSDLVFITHFPTKKRAWYSYADPENPKYTLSFDLIGRGVEWISGSQRIHLYQELIDKIKKIGNDPADYEIPYAQAFRYGMPPEGGFAIGLERITQNILGLENIRQATLYPRDMERVDARLSVIGRPFETSAPQALSKRLIDYLDENKTKYEHITHQPTKTSAESAQARGTKLEQDAKALLMIADKDPILVVLSAVDKLDGAKFKKLFGFKQLRMADPQEVKKISSVDIGAVPPFGNLFKVPTYVDNHLLSQKTIAFNAGSTTESIIMASKDFVGLVNPKAGDYIQT